MDATRDKGMDYSVVTDTSSSERRTRRTDGSYYTGRAKKVIPRKNSIISLQFLAAIFTKFERFTDEDSLHMSCKFY